MANVVMPGVLGTRNDTQKLISAAVDQALQGFSTMSGSFLGIAQNKIGAQNAATNARNATTEEKRLADATRQFNYHSLVAQIDAIVKKAYQGDYQKFAQENPKQWLQMLEYGAGDKATAAQLSAELLARNPTGAEIAMRVADKMPQLSGGLQAEEGVPIQDNAAETPPVVTPVGASATPAPTVMAARATSTPAPAPAATPAPAPAKTPARTQTMNPEAGVREAVAQTVIAAYEELKNTTQENGAKPTASQITRVRVKERALSKLYAMDPTLASKYVDDAMAHPIFPSSAGMVDAFVLAVDTAGKGPDEAFSRIKAGIAQTYGTGETPTVEAASVEAPAPAAAPAPLTGDWGAISAALKATGTPTSVGGYPLEVYQRIQQIDPSAFEPGTLTVVDNGKFAAAATKLYESGYGQATQAGAPAPAAAPTAPTAAGAVATSGASSEIRSYLAAYAKGLSPEMQELAFSTLEKLNNGTLVSEGLSGKEKRAYNEVRDAERRMILSFKSLSAADKEKLAAYAGTDEETVKNVVANVLNMPPEQLPPAVRAAYYSPEAEGALKADRDFRVIQRQLGMSEYQFEKQFQVSLEELKQKWAALGLNAAGLVYDQMIAGVKAASAGGNAELETKFKIWKEFSDREEADMKTFVAANPKDPAAAAAAYQKAISTGPESQEVFRKNHELYLQITSQMFGWPIEDIKTLDQPSLLRRILGLFTQGTTNVPGTERVVRGFDLGGSVAPVGTAAQNSPAVQAYLQAGGVLAPTTR